MKVGFLFPGQGTQSVGMGKDLYDTYEEVRQVYDICKNVTGIDIAKISFEGPEDVLNQTRYTQLAVLVMSLGILKVLEKNGIEFDSTSGLSLGEYASLVSSGILSVEEAIKIVDKRGTYMQELVPEGDWQMAAVLGLDDQTVEKLCNEVKEGFATCANFNCNGQVVVTGDKKGIEALMVLAKEQGAKRVLPLNTAGPFHTEKLIDASNALRRDLNNVSFNVTNKKVYKNLDASLYSKESDYVDILAKHIVSPVRFSTILKEMLADGVDTFIEIGPGKTLSGFVKKTNVDKEINIYNVNSVDTLSNCINEL